jgi:hypothetical protein
MNRQPLRLALACAVLIVASIVVAAKMPSASASRRRTQVLGTQVRAVPTTTRALLLHHQLHIDDELDQLDHHDDDHAGSARSPRPDGGADTLASITLTETTPALDHVPTTDKVIFLGIDDGLVRDPAPHAPPPRPHPPHVVPGARTAHDGAAFFKQMQSLGATVQDHTVDHPQLKQLGWSDQHHQICDELPDLTTIYGRPTLFRPPYGEWNETTRSVVSGCGLRDDPVARRDERRATRHHRWPVPSR